MSNMNKTRKNPCLDDDGDPRQAIAEGLRGAGHEMHAPRPAAEGLEWRMRDMPGLASRGIAMARMRGRDVSKTIREYRPERGSNASQPWNITP